MVTILFDKCAELWNRCPAVEAMDNGIETAEEIPDDGNPDKSELGLLPFAENDPAREDSTGVTTWDESAKDAVEKTVDARRNLISKLKKEKNSKLATKTTTENRMLALGHEELQLKKRMIDQLEKSEEKYMESMQSFTASLHSLSSTLQNGFNMLGMMMQQNHQQNQHLRVSTTIPNISNSKATCQVFGIYRILLILISVEH